MRITLFTSFLVLSQLLVAQTRFDVSSPDEFDAAHDAANAGDYIVWASGVYSDVFMDLLSLPRFLVQQYLMGHLR